MTPKEMAERVWYENSLLEPAVDAKEIAMNYGLKIIPVIFKEEKSHIYSFLDYPEKTIYVNHLNNFKTINFSIARELGHYLLNPEMMEKTPKKYTCFVRCPLAGYKILEDKMAIDFAAYLLVPNKFLDKYKDIATVKTLSKAFLVPEEVIRYRIDKKQDCGIV